MLLVMLILAVALPTCASQLSLELERGPNLVFVTVQGVDSPMKGIHLSLDRSYLPSFLHFGEVTRVSGSLAKPELVFSLPINVLEENGPLDWPLSLIVNDASAREWKFQVPVKIASAATSRVEQNVPNPFNPTTHITYALSDHSASGPISLIIYNTLGQRIKTLVSETQRSGSYSVLWDGKDDQGRRMSSGIYFYRLQAGDFVQTRRMLLLQ